MLFNFASSGVQNDQSLCLRDVVNLDAGPRVEDRWLRAVRSKQRYLKHTVDRYHRSIGKDAAILQSVKKVY